MKLPSHWAKDTVKSFWQCFWYDVAMIILGALMIAGSVAAVFWVSQDYYACCVFIAGSGLFLIMLGIVLLLFLLDF